jgi:hypothetical protein
MVHASGLWIAERRETKRENTVLNFIALLLLFLDSALSWHSCSFPPESIEWFIEDLAFSPSYDLAPPPPLPFSREQVVSLSQSSCGRREGRKWSQIIQRPETQALYKTPLPGQRQQKPNNPPPSAGHSVPLLCRQVSSFTRQIPCYQPTFLHAEYRARSCQLLTGYSRSRTCV